MPNINPDDFLPEDDDEFVEFNVEKMKELIPSYTNEKLCEMIVCDRYFGFEKKISTACMEELSNRRANGDSFNFESYIDQKFNELPVLDLNTPDIRSILQQSVGRKI